MVTSSTRSCLSASPTPPATFQDYVNKILAEKLDVFIIVYLEDILIYTEDPGQAHVEAVRWVLENLWRHGLFANLKKCGFHQDEVRFLGYVVYSQGVRVEDERVEAVKSATFRCLSDSPTSTDVSSKGSARLLPPHLDAQDKFGNQRPIRLMVVDDEAIGEGGGGKSIEKSTKSKKSAKGQLFGT